MSPENKGNAFVYTEQNKEQRPSIEERQKDLVQYDNVKTFKKKEENPLWKWIKDVFFSGRTLKEILKDVAENQIVPQMKDNFRNSMVSMLDLSLYKEHVNSSSSSQSSNFITNYVTFSNPSSAKKTEPTPEEKEKKIVENGYELPSFENKPMGVKFLNDMKAYATKYDMFSVFELYGMRKKKIDYTWDKYGWNKEEILAIDEPKHVNGEWVIFLPKAHVLE